MNVEDNNRQQLKDLAEEQGISLFGVGEVEPILKGPNHMSPALSNGLDRAICMGALLSRRILDEIEGHPTKLYFYHYRRLNNLLDNAAIRVTNSIQTAGYEALPVPASQTMNWEEQTALISHREAAHAAGLGFWGLNNLLINRRFGAQVRLVTVLTDMPLPPDRPVEQNHCDDCKACIPLCPAGAIGEQTGDFDRWACLEKLKEFSKKHNIGQYICGICVKACPGAML